MGYLSDPNGLPGSVARPGGNPQDEADLAVPRPRLAIGKLAEGRHAAVLAGLAARRGQDPGPAGLGGSRRHDLAAGRPAIPLEPGQVTAMLAGAIRARPQARRDLAMLTLLARLGLPSPARSPP